MYHFFIEASAIEGEGIRITDPEDRNHIRNVLRMREGDRICLCCEEREKEYICRIRAFEKEEILLDVEDINGSSRELPVRITLFQGLPKGDKMDLVIQKAVELGAVQIVPVVSRRTVVRLDPKKAEKKVRRWNEIARNAARQAKRGLIPSVTNVMKFDQAVEYGKSMDMLIIPYEEAGGIDHSREIVASVKGKESLGIYIGPEGGFEVSEVDLAMAAGAHPITLGRRILRTETAGMALLSILSFYLEEENV